MASFTKFAILKVFGDLAASRPVDKITVKDITDQCGISRNTFYYHYQCNLPGAQSLCPVFG